MPASGDGVHGGTMHCRPEQTGALSGQTLLHPPQLCGSLSKFTHESPQQLTSVEAGHVIELQAAPPAPLDPPPPPLDPPPLDPPPLDPPPLDPPPVDGAPREPGVPPDAGPLLVLVTPPQLAKTATNAPHRMTPAVFAVDIIRKPWRAVLQMPECLRH